MTIVIPTLENVKSKVLTMPISWENSQIENQLFCLRGQREESFWKPRTMLKTFYSHKQNKERIHQWNRIPLPPKVIGLETLMLIVFCQGYNLHLCTKGKVNKHSESEWYNQNVVSTQSAALVQLKKLQNLYFSWFFSTQVRLYCLGSSINQSQSGEVNNRMRGREASWFNFIIQKEGSFLFSIQNFSR